MKFIKIFKQPSKNKKEGKMPSIFLTASITNESHHHHLKIALIRLNKAFFRVVTLKNPVFP